MNENYTYRPMQQGDWDAVAKLIRHSTNRWYQAHGRDAIFTGDPGTTRLFCEVYEALDPGRCLLAVHQPTGAIAGSCFYHPRPTHVALGIMNVHPDHFGHAVARSLLRAVTDFADAHTLPTRLVSSAMNLDSFSLYTRAGFVPRQAFQDMLLHVPPGGMTSPAPPGVERVRPARAQDLDHIAALEHELTHIQRPGDYRFFLDNTHGIWHTLVIESPQADGIDGVLASVRHPACTMLGPGATRTQGDAAALIYAQLQHHRGGCPVWLVPVQADRLVAELYRWGARNCELHFAQVRGAWRPPAGVVMPTFMPETA